MTGFNKEAGFAVGAVSAAILLHLGFIVVLLTRPQQNPIETEDLFEIVHLPEISMAPALLARQAAPRRGPPARVMEPVSTDVARPMERTAPPPEVAMAATESVTPQEPAVPEAAASVDAFRLPDVGGTSSSALGVEQTQLAMTATSPGPAVAETGAGGEAYPASDIEAAYRNNPPPPYPLIARRKGQEGVVILKVLLDARGYPLVVEVKESSGHAILDESAVVAVTKWRFAPAQRAGLAVKSVVEFPLRFALR